MRLKRIEAATVAEGMRRLRAELGEHAVILHTKTVDAGDIGGGRIEILGAVDEPATRWPAPRGAGADLARYDAPVAAPPMTPRREARPAFAAAARREAQPQASPTPAAQPRPALAQTPAARQAQVFVAATPPVQAGPAPARRPTPPAHRAAAKPVAPADTRSVTAPAVEQTGPDRRAEIAARLARFQAAVPTVPLAGADKHTNPADPMRADTRTAPADPMRADAHEAPAEPTRTAEPMPDAGGPTFSASSWDRMPGRARRVAFIGPTGAGKTTTLAKIAARAQLDHGRRVSLITIDTYRIGAVPQLASYAEILGVPLHVAQTPEELARAVEETRDADIVYIDTVGRSPLGGGVEGLKPFLEAAAPDEVCLVLSATTRPADSLRAAASYGRLGPDRLCVTKLDETDDHSTVPLLSEATRLPLGWLGTGQGVPDDLEEAEPGRLARLNTGRAA